MLWCSTSNVASNPGPMIAIKIKIIQIFLHIMAIFIFLICKILSFKKLPMTKLNLGPTVSAVAFLTTVPEHCAILI